MRGPFSFKRMFWYKFDCALQYGVQHAGTVAEVGKMKK